jgi:hypothetical protein
LKKILLFALVSWSCIGCSGAGSEPALLTDGSYECTGFANPDLSDVLVAGTKLELRKSEMMAKFSDTEGQETEVTFTETPEEDWPTGCHTNVGGAKLETVALDVSELTIGDVTLEDVTLTASCTDGDILLTGVWLDCEEGVCDDGEVVVNFDRLP